MSTTPASLETILQNLNIEALNDMQKSAIQTIPQQENVVLLASTGSGKTLGFLLPLLQMLDRSQSGIQALILSPSRELALQIEQVFKSMGTGYKVNCCYGGHNARIEKNNLSQPPSVLVGTPGRIVDHLKNERIDTSTIKTLIFDEYDKCLEFGFKEDISFIVGQLSKVTKRILTSATQSTHDYSLVGMKNPTILQFVVDTAPENLKIKSINTADNDKLNTLFRLVCKIGSEPTLIFCNMRDTVEQISDSLWDKKLPNNVFHGGLDQDIRERTLIKFRNGSHRILVTTDLAARGLDIPEIEHVIHFDLPGNESIFTHRNGRTARMHATGTAYLLVGERERLPSFLKEAPQNETLPARTTLPEKSPWETIYISAGKKEKISKSDIVGLLMQKGKLEKDELGLIEILDHVSFVAIKRTIVDRLLQLVRNEPLKKQKVKIDIARQ